MGERVNRLYRPAELELALATLRDALAHPDAPTDAAKLAGFVVKELHDRGFRIVEITRSKLRPS